MHRLKALSVIALLVVLGACSNNDDDPEATTATDEVSLSIGDVASSVDGNVVTLPIDVTGVEIVKADGDTSGDTGHFHIFIDQEPVEEGDVIPRERDIVHSTDNPIKLWGLLPGEHELTVVLGNGVHERIEGDVSDSITVDVEGPSVRGTTPASIEEGADLEIELAAEGVEIVAADGETSGETGHFHVLVDPEQAPAAGELIPAAEENKIIHTAESSATVSGLAKGEHIIWVVLGDGTHTAVEPAVMDKLTVTVA